MSVEFELWQMARDWLNALNVIPGTEACLNDGARVYDLALALQDGTVLCNALNTLVPGSVEQVQLKPDKQFLKMENIEGFLHACVNTFKLKDTDMFTADQLYYASDFQKVISCLSALSRSKVVAKSGQEGFPVGQAKTTALDGNEDMYQSLEDLVGQSISFASATRPTETDDDIYGCIRNVVEDNEGDEDVYAAMVNAQEELYQSVTGPADKRNNVLSELYDTEKNYVEVLRVIIDKFKKTLEQSKLNKADITLIFSNVTELMSVHQALLREIELQMQSTTGRNISAPFAKICPKMKVYGRFVCEIPVALARLKKLMTEPKFAKILDEAREKSSQRFPLKDLLNVPMQRVLKYPLLIKELIRGTPDNHPDKQKLLVTQQTVVELASFINQTKKDFDALKKVEGLVRNYKGPEMATIAPMVKDGDLKYSETKGGKLKDIYIFLFQKGLVMCKKERFKFTEFISIDEKTEVIDAESVEGKGDENGKHTFLFVLKTPTKELHFATKALALKRQWMASMANCLDALKDHAGAKPQAEKRTPGSIKIANTKADPVSRSATPKASSASKPSVQRVSSYEPWAPTNSNNSASGADTPVKQKFKGRGGDEGWFGGRLDRTKAGGLLDGTPNGTFLVRESDSRPGDYSLSVQFDSVVKHIKINRHGNLYDLAPDAKSFASIQELVEYFQAHSLNRHFPGMETELAIPFKNAIGVKSGLFGKQKEVGVGRARSRFAYQAKSNDELSFERGIEILVLSTEDQDPGWWKGQLPDGQIGMFPANYVQSL
eukprot:m.100075 g.100075  ORF g.100075 m.100075 type:complete len:776 (-) comp27218_c0_seq1:153-2480(-)